MEFVSQDLISSLLTMGKTYQDISTELKNVYPDVKRGLSEQSVRRYVWEHDLKSLCEQAIQECSSGMNSSCCHTLSQFMSLCCVLKLCSWIHNINLVPRPLPPFQCWTQH